MAPARNKAISITTMTANNATVSAICLLFLTKKSSTNAMAIVIYWANQPLFAKKALRDL
ncbi:MAG: hypothetical protein L7F77_01420 [Candidatus Magnetominusculus sp. LBB02]|nr:hypothetical protein [Candidatus Magnetominusculus sp. LBB02]